MSRKKKKAKPRKQTVTATVAKVMHFSEAEEQFFALGDAIESGEWRLEEEEPRRPSLLERLLFRHRLAPA
jgi:hypothetical protein